MTEFAKAEFKRQVYTIVKDMQFRCEHAILMTPSSQLRDDLTDINIKLMLLEKQIETATVKVEQK